jgi:hypothetical protein
MIHFTDKYKKGITDVNAELAALKGELDNKEATHALVRFLMANLGITVELLSGVKIFPIQELLLKALFKRNFSLLVMSRGGSKSFIASVFCFLYVLFNPGTKILLSSANFRSSRKIFTDMQKMILSPAGKLLQHAFGTKAEKQYKMQNDVYEWVITFPNGALSSIVALPLSEKIRGYRANILILDEFLLLSNEFIEAVLMPFLTAPIDIEQKVKIREMEAELISKGLMKEEDRMIFDNKVKMIGLSSASYTFENLYKIYNKWINEIMEPVKDNEASISSYFVAQIGWEAIPPEILDRAIIHEAKSGGMAEAVFKREFEALFTDGSDSYFSPQKMFNCTIPIGQSPVIRLKGNRDKKYILSIDPNGSDSPTGDFFAMCVLELNEENQTATVVHNYGKAGVGLSNHINYLFYILTHFNIVMIIGDNAGTEQFLQAANESQLFKEHNTAVHCMDFDCVAEGDDYRRELESAKMQYNLEGKKIAFTFVFSKTGAIRKANEELQKAIDFKKIFFASKIAGNFEAFDAVEKMRIDLERVGEGSLSEFVSTQDRFMDEVKAQAALIEVRTSPAGHQEFDLPANLKRDHSSPNRVRRDNYTALFLGNWGAKCYYDMQNMNVQEDMPGFIPVFIN